MKYVVTANESGKEEIFIFNRNINHDDFAETVSYIKRRDLTKHHGHWECEYCKPIAAGFYEGGKCVGHSETLNLKSRGAIDETLINNSR